MPGHFLGYTGNHMFMNSCMNSYFPWIHTWILIWNVCQDASWHTWIVFMKSCQICWSLAFFSWERSYYHEEYHGRDQKALFFHGRDQKAKIQNTWHDFMKTMNSSVPRSVLTNISYQNSYMNSWKIWIHTWIHGHSAVEQMNSYFPWIHTWILIWSVCQNASWHTWVFMKSC